MRKLLLTTAFALPLSMTAAYAQDTAADPAATAADESSAQMDSTAMPEAGAEETTDADAAAAEQEAMAQEVAASGKVAQQQAANELRLDWITDATVTSPDGEGIGDINDLIVDGESGSMIAAVIGVGGFLGIGEKQIAVPWETLTVNYDAQEITSELTKDEADAAPEYVFRDQESAPAAEGEMAPAAGDDAMATDPMAPAAGDPMAPAEGDAMAPAEGDAMGGTDAIAPAEGGTDTMDPAAADSMTPAEGEVDAEEAMDGAAATEAEEMPEEQPAN
ncbi:PRC-barrel domain-containing protein [Paracoccus homiensis]|uniref:PRC-barrel domain-containing protein n=1 Tax=Paracoccus homiensis TaxID=364199 RepID=A0A1I0FGU6_9RHOB|nr:PRC-barrel domain-containing protein [Paracoccus homiensis]SET57446.1 PRC-barrel domain-containing protein [Paracoccus homiensis]